MQVSNGKIYFTGRIYEKARSWATSHRFDPDLPRWKSEVRYFISVLFGCSGRHGIATRLSWMKSQAKGLFTVRWKRAA